MPLRPWDRVILKGAGNRFLKFWINQPHAPPYYSPAFISRLNPLCPPTPLPHGPGLHAHLYPPLLPLSTLIWWQPPTGSGQRL